MKKIEAIIRPSKVGDVCKALREIGNTGLMITEIEGYGQQRGVEQEFRGKTYKTELLTKALLVIVANDSEVDKIIRTIKKSSYTGKEGDGKIFVSRIEQAIKIRTGEQDEKAI